MPVNTTQMGLPIPSAGDSSPSYMNSIATAFNTLDTHDHTSGKGSPITQSGINISGALPLNNNALTLTRNVQFSSLGAPLNLAADNGSLHMVNGDLYFLTGLNQLVRLTIGGNGAGAIGGDYNNFPLAQIIYNNPDLSYYFFNSANALARILGSSVSIGATPTTAGTVSYDNSTTSFSFKDSTSALCKGNFASVATSGTVTAVGGVTQGSRFVALRGVVGSTQLTTNGTYVAQAYNAGATPSFSQVTFFAPFAGSIAAISAKTYGNTATAGTITVSTSGLGANASTSSITAAIANSGGFSTFAPGTFTFNAASSIALNVQSLSWAQAATGTGGVEVYLWVYC